MDTQSTWYLLKNEDNTLFGPVPFSQLRQWAAAAQISPLDKVSTDQVNWNRAPTYPDLHMDWLVQPNPGQLYGPTTIGALREFIRAGEINADSVAINCVEATQCRIHDINDLADDLNAPHADDSSPNRASVRENLQQHVRDLEKLLLDERRRRIEAEEALEKLSARYLAATGKQP